MTYKQDIHNVFCTGKAHHPLLSPPVWSLGLGPIHHSTQTPWRHGYWPIRTHDSQSWVRSFYSWIASIEYHCHSASYWKSSATVHTTLVRVGEHSPYSGPSSASHPGSSLKPHLQDKLSKAWRQLSQPLWILYSMGLTLVIVLKWRAYTLYNIRMEVNSYKSRCITRTVRNPEERETRI